MSDPGFGCGTTAAPYDDPLPILEAFTAEVRQWRSVRICEIVTAPYCDSSGNWRATLRGPFGTNGAVETTDFVWGAVLFTARWLIDR